MAWRFNSSSPVYIQIAERIKNLVFSGEYKAGEQIPSVRQLAQEAAVNPNTIQHAFIELENEGFIISKGTLGRFVTEDESVIESYRQIEAKKLAHGVLKNAKRMGVSKEKLISLIEGEEI